MRSVLHPTATLLLLAALAWAAAAQDGDGWERVRPGLELRYPADHGAHPDHRIEWWYVCGRLDAEDGRRIGFQFTVFRSGLAPGLAPGLRARHVLAGHLALTDVERGSTRLAERVRRASSPLALAAVGDLDLALEDWSLRRVEQDGRERLVLAAADPALGFGVELELEPTKPLVLHGERGFSPKGEEPGNASAYASWTRLAARGRVRVDGDELAALGSAWFDHEFGTSVLEPGVVGWDWFGLQLADGRELMLFELRRADGSRAPASAGTLVAPDGTARHLAAGDFAVRPSGSWTSPRTGAAYPARWRIEVPGADLRLEVLPPVAECELDSTRSTGVAYWEGPVDVRGSTGGRGYAELTGYAGSMEGRL